VQSNLEWEESFSMRIPNDGAALTIMLVSAFLLCCAAAKPNASGDRIRIVPNEADRRVDIIIDGQPFTSYIWPATLAKPVLYSPAYRHRDHCHQGLSP
jgi:hypothetical protein